MKSPISVTELAQTCKKLPVVSGGETMTPHPCGPISTARQHSLPPPRPRPLPGVRGGNRDRPSVGAGSARDRHLTDDCHRSRRPRRCSRPHVRRVALPARPTRQQSARMCRRQSTFVGDRNCEFNLWRARTQEAFEGPTYPASGGLCDCPAYYACCCFGSPQPSVSGFFLILVANSTRRLTASAREGRSAGDWPRCLLCRLRLFGPRESSAPLSRAT
jgi:hypothetical protein